MKWKNILMIRSRDLNIFYINGIIENLEVKIFKNKFQESQNKDNNKRNQIKWMLRNNKFYQQKGKVKRN